MNELMIAKGDILKCAACGDELLKARIDLYEDTIMMASDFDKIQENLPTEKYSIAECGNCGCELPVSAHVHMIKSN